MGIFSDQTSCTLGYTLEEGDGGGGETEGGDGKRGKKSERDKTETASSEQQRETK